MKRNLIQTLFAALLLSSLFISCEPMEPSSRTEIMSRYATVRSNGTNAYLIFDGVNEIPRIKNFSNASDMKSFNLKDGDRVLATISVKVIENTVGEIVTIEYISKIDTHKLATSQPSDTLNQYFTLNTLEIGRLQYPSIWSQGHYVNIAPVVYAQNTIKNTPKFKLYPLYVFRDTLVTRLYSDFPESDFGNNYITYQDVYCFDLSSLKDPVSDPQEQESRDSILARLGRIGSNFIIKIIPRDTLRSKYTKPDSIYVLDNLKPSSPVSVSVAFDF